MDVQQALAKRKSTRGFLNKNVSKENILKILDAAKYSPSGGNIQPWQLAVVTGNKKQQLQHLLEHAFLDGEERKMDYAYYPSEWREPFDSRRRACALQLYSSVEISKKDKSKRYKQWAANYRAFDAPVMIFIFIPPGLSTGAFVDCGIFLQSFMLAALHEGLATCPQAALAEYPGIVKKYLQYPENYILICGLALGYEDTNAKINCYRTPREDVREFCQFFD